MTRCPRSRLAIGRALLATAVAVYLAQGFFLSRALVSSDDEESYLALGRLAVTGAISLYQDELTGQRMPLPFYVLGATQVVGGPDLWIGRLVSLFAGLGALVLTAAVAHRLHGPLAAALAALLLATQGAIVGYYATAAYHALTALILMTAVWLLLRHEMPWRHAVAMAAASVLFFTRTNMFPALPFFFGWTLWGARRALERAAVMIFAAAPPALFFLSDPTHLKLLAHVPVLHRLVEPLGYRSILEFSAIHRATIGEQLWAFVTFARRYESWVIATAGLALAWGLWLRMRRRAGGALPSARILAVAGLLVWVLAWHFVMWRANFKMVAAYFPDFAPLGAVLLGVGFAALLDAADLPRFARGIGLLALAAALSISAVYPRHPLLPRPAPWPFHGDSVQEVNQVAAQLKTLVPADARVFVFAQPMAAYLAGLRLYLQHAMSPGRTLAAASADPGLVARSGAWGLAEVERWLGQEAAYAIMAPRLVDGLEPFRPESVHRMRELLQERFVLIGRVGNNPLLVADVYKRR